MAKKKRAFTLRYGESRQNDMLAYFVSDETILENLSRIIPSAVQRGFLPADCTHETVKLICDDRPLNLNVGVDEQAFTVPERAVLTIQDLSSTVRIRVKYTPDNHAERTDSVFVNPNKILGDELEKYFKTVTKDYKFYRRKPKKYHLVADGKKVNGKKSLVAQGYDSGFDAALKPRLLLRWPPPTLVMASAGIVVTAFIVFLAWSAYDRYLRKPPPVELFYVTLTADAESRFAGPDTTVSLMPGEATMLALAPGLHAFEVMPRDYPLFDYTFTLVGEGAPSDSVAKFINVQSRFAETPALSVVITGYRGEIAAENRILESVVINGFPRPVDEFGSLKVSLLKGLYDIKYELPDDALDEDNLQFDPRVYRPSTFRFDFTGFGEDDTYLTFQYGNSPTPGETRPTTEE